MQIKNYHSDSSLDDSKLSLGRLMCMLCIGMFLAGIVLDYFSAPRLMMEILSLRIAICTVLGLILCLSLYTPKLFIKLYSYIISFLFLYASLTVQVMIYLTEPADIAHSTYFAGLMLIIVTVFLGTYISTALSIFLSIAIIISFSVMSYMMPNFDLALLVNNGFFLISSLLVGVISNAMKNGFLSQILLLQTSLKESLRDQHLETKRQSELANQDSVTYIPNRRYGIKLLEKMIDNADKLEMTVIVYFLDLNGFKKINDTYGHNVGDEVLRTTANRLTEIGRSSDILFRQGGDEFVYAILLEKDNLKFSDEFSEMLVKSIKQPMMVDGLRLAVGTSIGQSVYPYNGLTVMNLINIADKNMYEMKINDRNEINDSIPSIEISNEQSFNNRVIDLNNFNKKK